MNQADKKLFKGIRQSSLSKVQSALQEGANVNAIKNNGSPLFYAAWLGNAAIVELLCERGAAVNFRHTQTQETPLHIAVAGALTDIVRILCHYGADPTLSDVYGNTARGLVEDTEEFLEIHSILDSCGLEDPTQAAAAAAAPPLPNTAPPGTPAPVVPPNASANRASVTNFPPLPPPAALPAPPNLAPARNAAAPPNLPPLPAAAAQNLPLPPPTAAPPNLPPPAATSLPRPNLPVTDPAPYEPNENTDPRGGRRRRRRGRTVKHRSRHRKSSTRSRRG